MAATPEIDFEHFLGVDMRVGRVVEVEDFPEARNPSLEAADRLRARGRPVRSEVLVLGAVDAEGRVALLRPDSGAAPGERIG